MRHGGQNGGDHPSRWIPRIGNHLAGDAQVVVIIQKTMKTTKAIQYSPNFSPAASNQIRDLLCEMNFEDRQLDRIHQRRRHCSAPVIKKPFRSPDFCFDVVLI